MAGQTFTLTSGFSSGVNQQIYGYDSGSALGAISPGTLYGVPVLGISSTYFSSAPAHWENMVFFSAPQNLFNTITVGAVTLTSASASFFAGGPGGGNMWNWSGVTPLFTATGTYTVVFDQVASSATKAGTFTNLFGTLSITDLNNAVTTPSQGTFADINVGDTLATGATGRSSVTLLDNSSIILQENTQVKIQAFTFNPATPPSNNLVIEVLQGIARFVTGAINSINGSNYSLTLPNGVAVGVRGTDYTTQVLPDGSSYITVSSGVVNVTKNGVVYTIYAGQYGWFPVTGTPVIGPAIGQVGKIMDNGIINTPTPIKITGPTTFITERGTGGAVEAILRVIDVKSTVIAYQVDSTQLSVIVESPSWGYNNTTTLVSSDADLQAAIRTLPLYLTDNTTNYDFGNVVVDSSNQFKIF